jgi:transcriptional regulator of acetoin/glycerol metabolism
VIAALQAYSWPGNIRELKNTMERLCILQGSGPPSLEALPAELRNASPAARSAAPAAVPAKASAANADSLLALLQKHRWNKSKAAQELGVSRPTFLKRLREAGID